MRRVVMLLMMVLLSIPAFAKDFDFGNFVEKLEKIVPKVETRRQYESGQPTIRIYEEKKEDYYYHLPEDYQDNQQAVIYQQPVVRVYEQEKEVPSSYKTTTQYPAIQSQIAEKEKEDESKGLIPILIIGLAVLVVEGFAIWYLDKRLLYEFGYDILSTGKLFLFGVQTLPIVFLALKGAFYGLATLDIAFGLGFIGIIAGIQFYMDKRNTNLKYATILLFVRLVASIFVAIVVIILLVLLYMWFIGLRGGRRKEDELTDEEIQVLKKLAQNKNIRR